ncbi:hypothetical protein LJB42_000250 [Komagataella kurtzmanii]|nr:hypothetical protein LJB42_000250 [Komagataella kurtzmanii]
MSDPQEQLKKLQVQITQSKRETKQLYFHLDRVLKSCQDSNLTTIYRQQVPNGPPVRFDNFGLYHVLRGHFNKISQIRWGPADSYYLLSSSQDGFMIIWDTLTGYKVKAIPLDVQWVLSCAYSPDGQLLASGGLSNRATIYNFESGTSKAVLKGHTCYISDMGFLGPDKLITASGDMNCILWDVNRAIQVNTYVDHLGDVLSLAVDQKNGRFVSGASDGYAKVWDCRSACPVYQYVVGHNEVTVVEQLTDHLFAAGTDDGTIKLFDMRSDGEINRYNPPFLASTVPPALHQNHQGAADDSSVTSIAFSSSGRLMFATYADKGCVVWDPLANQLLGELSGHSNQVNQVRVNGQGNGVATSSWDSTIKIWGAT